MTRKQLTFSILILGCWLFTSVFIDFFLIKNVFRTVDDLFLSGKIGLQIFGSFNKFELFFGILLLICCYRSPRKMIIFLSSLLLILAGFYTFFLTDKISELTQLWETTLAQNLPSAVEYQNEQQLWHSRYIFFDTVKICIIIILEIYLLRIHFKESPHVDQST